MTQMIELVGKDMKYYYNYIPYVQHGRLKHKHTKERHGKYKKDEKHNA